MIGRDGAAGLACLAGSVLLLVLTRGLPQAALVPIGPAFYPRILLAITACLSLVLVVSDLRPANRARAAAPVRYRLVILTFLVFAGYVLALPHLGYRIATFAFVTILQATLEPPQRPARWALVLAVALLTTLVTYYVFEGYLSVLLPRGRLTGF
ncbi:MAG: tripartite tricarboxylate transporter TctB family protein [Candidatus Rokubacteria bacterium]|nr:tripartite tricarboxylate transporter TctB family protein [Candidatus Rokubacteria bacterium]